ncbi:alpha/beta hydrolase [Geodermatophilus sabuli]|uniref:Alpha/beta hydrolase n=1 Tax=Geodermatophilus sabuli TaxID=1564158 RepID=A0A7K3VUU4_9ACTN|nr:alpha/beta hydrolase [Geodermatophilus sabuli]NEK56416.1 alpha/beta hydrolase [Geodermatophilus sabuli]
MRPDPPDPAAPSADPQAAVTITRDLPYAERDGVPLQLDLYVPRTVGPPPVCVYLHGGGWLRGSRSDRATERLLPVAATGVAVAAVSYRLSGQAVFPAQLEDVRSAVRWLRASGAGHGVDARRVGVWGASAGGHLAALAGLCPDPRDGEAGDSSVQGVVTFFPTTDLLARGTDTPEGPPPPFISGPPLVPSFEARLLGLERAADDPERARAASPLTHVRAGAPPFLLLHGDADGLVPSSHSRRLAQALRAAGVPTTFLLLGGANHEDPAFDTPATLGAVSGFLRAALT